MGALLETNNWWLGLIPERREVLCDLNFDLILLFVKNLNVHAVILISRWNNPSTANKFCFSTQTNDPTEGKLGFTVSHRT